MTQERDRLSQQLSHLPRVRATPQFTRRVLERLDRSARPVRPLPQLAVAALAAAAIVAVWSVVGARLWTGEMDASPAELSTARAPHPRFTEDELAEEYRQIAAELAELRRLADESAPVLYLTSTPDYDVVLDLRTLMASESARRDNGSGSRRDVRPARLDG